MTEETTIVENSELKTGSKASNFINWFNPFSRGLGMYAFLFQRITGLCLLIYVFIHMSIIGMMLLDPFLGLDQAGLLYNTVVHAMNQNLVDTGNELINHMVSLGFFIDAGVMAFGIYHGANGIRVILFDLGIGIRRQKMIFWIFLVLGVISWVLGLLLIASLPGIVIGGYIGG
jgi:succinate dehydrogenase / fumarate reductase cytochrome b subunit